MEYGLMSHILLWVIGAMTLVAAVSVVGAVFSLGRDAYRKD